MTQQATAPAVLVCSQCGRTFGQSDLVQIAGNWVCGGCKRFPPPSIRLDRVSHSAIPLGFLVSA